MVLFFPGSAETAKEAFDERVQRLRNIEAIRVSVGFRRTPGSQPISSGPPFFDAGGR